MDVGGKSEVFKHYIVGWYRGIHGRNKMELEPVIPTFSDIANRHMILISRPDGKFEYQYVSEYGSIEEAIKDFEEDGEKQEVAKSG